MALLEALLKKRGAVFAPDAQPIQFELGAETWSFDPRRSGTLVERSACAEPALTVQCSPLVLGRLLTEPTMYLTAGEELKLVGDVSALNSLIAALGGG